MNIYVSNLGFHVGNEELKNLFAAFGLVNSVKVITDRESNQSRGFGFIEMQNEEEGQAAIDKLNGHVLEGRAMNVNLARPKEESNNKKRYSSNIW